jgi:hypothetical protein
MSARYNGCRATVVKSASNRAEFQYGSMIDHFTGMSGTSRLTNPAFVRAKHCLSPFTTFARQVLPN